MYGNSPAAFCCVLKVNLLCSSLMVCLTWNSVSLFPS